MPKADTRKVREPNDRVIVHIYFSEFKHESRAMRAIEAVLEAGIADRVEALAYKTDETPAFEQVTDKFAIRRFAVDLRLPLPRIIGRGISWLLWSFLVIRSIYKNPPLLVHFHAVASLPAAAIAKWLTGTKILYNAHDLETERTGWGWTTRMFSKALERSFIGSIDGMVTVSDHIADWYVDNYRMRRPALVRNIPVTKQSETGFHANSPSLRDALGIAPEDLLFIYIGAIDINRGLGILVDAFAQLPPNYHFATLGYGDLVPFMEQAAARLPNVHHHAAVPSKQVTSFIRDADVGICLIEDVSMNHRLTLPNKLFETRHGGLAALVSDLPAIADFIDTFGGGWKVKPDVDSVVACLRTIDRQAITNVMATAKPIPTWDDDKAVLLEETRRILGRFQS